MVVAEGLCLQLLLLLLPSVVSQLAPPPTYLQHLPRAAISVAQPRYSRCAVPTPGLSRAAYAVHPLYTPYAILFNDAAYCTPCGLACVLHAMRPSMRTAHRVA